METLLWFGLQLLSERLGAGTWLVLSERSGCGVKGGDTHVLMQRQWRRRWTFPEGLKGDTTRTWGCPAVSREREFGSWETVQPFAEGQGGRGLHLPGHSPPGTQHRRLVQRFNHS